MSALTAIRPTHSGQNVGTAERWASLVGGGLLAACGLRGRSLGGLALAGLGGALIYRGLSGRCACYAALGVSTAQRHGPATSVPAGHGFKFEQAVTIHRPAGELYRVWRNFENLPRYFDLFESVRITGERRSHWVAKTLGVRLEWDSEVINEREGELIAWRSLDGGDVNTAGSIHFTQAPQGTEVRVSLKYEPPAGKLGAWAAWLAGQDPERRFQEGLRRWKQAMEAGAAAAV